MIDIRNLTANIAVKLKPCPFCGGTATVKTHYTRRLNMSELLKRRRFRLLVARDYAECLKCGAQTSLHKSWVELEEAWNARVGESKEEHTIQFRKVRPLTEEDFVDKRMESL